MATDKPLNILVGLDLSDMDSCLLNYVKSLHEVCNIEKVTFLHNIKLGHLPKEYLSSDQLQKIKSKIDKKVKRRLEEAETPYPMEVKVTTDRFSETSFEDISKNNQFDLLVLGNKQKLRGNGALPYKLVRLFPSSILLVPETCSLAIKKIAGAITFSKYTQSILDWANRFDTREKEADIEYLPVNVSKLFYYPIMGKREVEKATQKDIESKKKQWSKEYKDYGELEVVPAADKSVTTVLLDYADKNKVDLMVLGVKSNSKIRELFIGSVANELIVRATNTCLVLVKR